MSQNPPLPHRALDRGIIRAVWLDLKEIRNTADRRRSPLVMHCIDHYAGSRRYPRDLLDNYPL